jgi:hypothetical protein
VAVERAASARRGKRIGQVLSSGTAKLPSESCSFKSICDERRRIGELSETVLRE